MSPCALPVCQGGVRVPGLLDCLTERPDMSAVAIDRTFGAPPATSGAATTEMLVLEAVAHRLGVAPVVLVPGEITVGSGFGCDIRLQVPGVEERHCVLQCSRARIAVQALDHRTWHNNLPITHSWLRLGDRLAVGPVEFRVRAVEPWDVLPAPESVRSIPAKPAIAENKETTPATPHASTADHATVEASLLQQIATLEATVARHQAAVAKLTQQQPTPTEVTPIPDRGSAPATSNVAPPNERPPLLSVATVPPRGTAVVDEERARWQAEIESNYQLSKRKLAELSLREESLQRQFTELGLQWEHLHVLIAHQEKAAAEWNLRAQQLDSWEQQCASREAELSSREQQLLVETELTATRQSQLQAEASQNAQQLAALNNREQTLSDWANQLTHRESSLVTQFNTLEQRCTDLEQREATYRAQCQEAEANRTEWNQSRETEETALARRREDLDVEATRTTTLAAELAQRQLEWEAQIARLQEEQQQLDAERARLTAWNNALNTSAADLAAETTGLSQRRDELVVARVELQRVEMEVEDFERQLLDYESELTERDAALIQAETECAWHERAWELSVLRSRPIPGEEARAEERLTETLHRTLEQLATDRDALATELFVMSTIAADTDDKSGISRHARIQTEQLRRDQHTLQQRAAKLLADQQALDAERLLLVQERQALEQQRQEHLATWTGQQAELATREQQLRAAGDALDVRDAELTARRNKLDGEQESLQQLTEFMQSRHEELALLRADLERQLIEASTQVERQTTETESRIAELHRREHELDERALALTQQEATLLAAQRELEQQRQVTQQEPPEWTPDRDSPRNIKPGVEETLRALDSIAYLEDVVQAELDQDRDFISEVDLGSSSLNLTTQEEIPPKTSEDLKESAAEPTTDAVSSLWNSASAPDMSPLTPAGQGGLFQNPTPTADEEFSPSNLRAKLAEMFNLDLSSEALATPAKSEQSSELEEEPDESQHSAPSAELQAAPEALSATEPEEDEYDSVESYMQRLLDRNRTAVAEFEASQPAHYSARTVPHDLGESLELEEILASATACPESEGWDANQPALESLPIVRPTIDATKVREGLHSLRQVANSSARSAIARSKWNKMRAQLVIQGGLAVLCMAVGGTIVGGHWLELFGTSVWGWGAVAIGIGLGVKNLHNMWTIYRFQIGRSEAISNEPKVESLEPPAMSSDE